MLALSESLGARWTAMDKMLDAADASDGSLAARAAAGSRAAFEELISRYTGRLYHFLRSRSASREDLEDLVQETFLKAYRNIDRYDERWKFATWLYTIALRQAISRHRAAGTGRVSSFSSAAEDPECPLPGPQETLVLREEAQRLKNIWDIAGTLGPGAYEALWLRYAEEMPVKDIARTMGKTQLGVRALLHRSRERLAAKIKAADQKGPLDMRAGRAVDGARPELTEGRSEAAKTVGRGAGEPAAGAANAEVPPVRKYSIL